MGCGSCGTTEKGVSKGCKNNGTCGTSGCNKLNVYDWFKDIDMPAHYEHFNIYEIRFKGSRKEFYKNTENLELYIGDAVVLESDLGHDVGHVSMGGELVKLQMKKAEVSLDNSQFKKIYRIATETDKEKYTEYKAKEPYTLERARTIALELKLEMKLSDIEFQGDGKKVIFFYTAEERVDFRELIKRYAGEFKTRIEMRQISYREEASRLGGIGSCGRELCCSTWLTDYKVVNISAARYQNLSINMLKLSGQCGRLKCCLNYELDTYLEAWNEFPENDKITLTTKVGIARVQKVDILTRKMWFSYINNGSEWIAMDVDKVNDIIEKNKKGIFPETLLDRPIGAEVINKTTFKVDDLISDNSLTRLEHKNPKKSNPNNKAAQNKPNQKPFIPHKNRPQNTQNSKPLIDSTKPVTANQNTPNKRPNQSSAWKNRINKPKTD